MVVCFCVPTPFVEPEAASAAEGRPVLIKDAVADSLTPCPAVNVELTLRRAVFLSSAITFCKLDDDVAAVAEVGVDWCAALVL